MRFVSKIDKAAAVTPPVYEKHSHGFRRATYVDRATGSVHMGVGVNFLDAGGAIDSHLHSFEESFYILEGSVTAQVAGQSHVLRPGDFGLIRTGLPHSWRNESGLRHAGLKCKLLSRVPATTEPTPFS